MEQTEHEPPVDPAPRKPVTALVGLDHSAFGNALRLARGDSPEIRGDDVVRLGSPVVSIPRGRGFSLLAGLTLAMDQSALGMRADFPGLRTDDHGHFFPRQRLDALKDTERRVEAIRRLKAKGHKQPKADQIRAEIRRMV